MKKTLIKLENVWKIYKMGDVNVNALQGMSLDVKEGEFVAIMGPSGSGKCVSGDTSIFLSDGTITSIKDLEDKKDIVVQALDKNDYKIKPFKVTGFYKRRVKDFLRITCSSGKVVIITNEHPFFTLSSAGITEILSKDLKKGIFIATSRFIACNGKKQFLNPFNHLSEYKNIVIKDSINLVRSTFKNLPIRRKEICENLGYNKGTYDSWLYQNNIPLYKFNRVVSFYGQHINTYGNKIKILGARNSSTRVSLPSCTSEELMEIYGYLVGDGNIDKDGIKITNKDTNLKIHIKNLFKKVFNFEGKEFISSRVDFNSNVLMAFFSKIFEVPLSQKSRNIKLPDFIFKCANKEIASFIRALFDCDAHANNNKKEINIALASKELIKQLEYMLLRFGIICRYGEKTKFATNAKDKTKRTYYSLSLSGYENLRLYKEFIGFNLSYKKRRLINLLSFARNNTNVDIIPCGALIKRLRQDSKITFSRKEHHILWPYESNKLKPSLNKLGQIINLFKAKGVKTDYLEKLRNSHIFWDKIVSVEIINKEIEVYDITVPEADNFIANGMILHNSTAVNMIGCLDVPTKGKIWLDSHDISRLSESELAQIRGKKIGFIFQQFNLIPTLSALENVMLPMIFQGVNEQERIERAAKLLELVELGDRIHHKPTELSGGEQQRVAIARALANNPEVVIADEPTGNLDSKTGANVLDFLDKLHKEERKTIIMVTHDQNLAKVAERIEFLKDGRIVRMPSNMARSGAK